MCGDLFAGCDSVGYEQLTFRREDLDRERAATHVARAKSFVLDAHHRSEAFDVADLAGISAQGNEWVNLIAYNATVLNDANAVHLVTLKLRLEGLFPTLEYHIHCSAFCQV